MKCNTVRTKLAGYLDDAVTAGPRVEERVQIRQHLEGCGVCREELERFRKLAVMLSRMPRNIPPADLAVRIKVAAAQAQHLQDWPTRMRRKIGRDTSELQSRRDLVCRLLLEKKKKKNKKKRIKKKTKTNRTPTTKPQRTK